MNIVSIDTETSNDKNRNIPIPFIATSTDTKLESQLFDLSKQEDYDRLNILCSDPNTIKVFHNAAYDIYVLANIGINVVPPFEDTMIMATLLNENFDSKKLKVLAKVHLNENCDEEAELKKVKAKLKRELKKSLDLNDEEEEDFDEFDYSFIPTDILYPYAIKDAIYTLKLYFLFRKAIYKNYKELYEFEKSLTPIVVEMTRCGFSIDRSFVHKMIGEYTIEVDQLDINVKKYLDDRDIHITKQIARKTDAGIVNQADKIGVENVIDVSTDPIKGYVLTYKDVFNPGSPQHLRTAIEKLEIPVTKFTGKKQEISTDKEAIASIPKDAKNYAFIDFLKRFRFLTKQLSSYYIPLHDRYTSESNDIAHFLFYQSGAKSGRFTAKLVQTIPRTDEVEDERYIRHIRKAFIPRKNKVLIAIDYDQIEMRIFADFSGCTLLIEAINDGFDPHLGTAYTLFGKERLDALPPEKVKTFRRIAKNINFGLIYGMGKNKLARSLGVPMGEAFNILDTYHKNYPVKQHIADMTGMLYKQGYVSIEADSELMKFRRDYRVPQELAYKAVNIRIQGMAAYCMKYGIKRCNDFIVKEKLCIPLTCSIHDELFFEVDEHDYSKDLVRALTTQMEDRISFKVPIIASPKTSTTSWGEAQELKLK